MIGTTNHYKTVDLYAGAYNATPKSAGVDRLENFPTEQIAATFQQMLDDWTNEAFDPFAAPQETGSPLRPQRATATTAWVITRARELATRCVGLETTWRCARRAAPREPRLRRCAAGRARAAPPICLFRKRGARPSARSVFLSRSQVTWNPSFTSVVKYSFMCPTTEEHILPIIHANDRVEWFFQMCDDIHWDQCRQDQRVLRWRA